MQIPAYLVIGTPTSGRRGVVWDAVERGSMEGEFSAVFVSSGEAPSDFDAAIAGADNAGIIKYSDAADAAEKLGAARPAEDLARVLPLRFLKKPRRRNRELQGAGVRREDKAGAHMVGRGLLNGGKIPEADRQVC